MAGKRLPKNIRDLLSILGGRRFLRIARKAAFYTRTCWARSVTTRLSLFRNRGSLNRRLEIGAAGNRVFGFETLNIQWGRDIDYVWDASKPLPFGDDIFEIVYASHILEHIPWFLTEQVLKEWARILKPGGHLEVWIPDGLKICQVIIESEQGLREVPPDDWNARNPDNSPYLWAAGRLFWGANQSYPSWHRAVFTPRYLKLLFERVRLVDVRELRPDQVRAYDHGWINLGMVGTKV